MAGLYRICKDVSSKEFVQQTIWKHSHFTMWRLIISMLSNFSTILIVIHAVGLLFGGGSWLSMFLILRIHLIDCNDNVRFLRFIYQKCHVVMDVIESCVWRCWVRSLQRFVSRDAMISVFWTMIIRTLQSSHQQFLVKQIWIAYLCISCFLFPVYTCVIVNICNSVSYN